MLDEIIVSSIGVAVAAILYGIFNLLRVGRRPTDIPPGPPTLPILGNLHQAMLPDLHTLTKSLILSRCQNTKLISSSRNGLRNTGMGTITQVDAANNTKSCIF